MQAQPLFSSSELELLAAPPDPPPPPPPPLASLFVVVATLSVFLCSLSMDPKYLAVVRSREDQTPQGEQRGEQQGRGVGKRCLQEDVNVVAGGWVAYLAIRGCCTAALRHSARLTIPSPSLSACSNSSFIIAASAIS